MSENLKLNAGKSLGIAGFVISLVMIVLGWMLLPLFAVWFGMAGPWIFFLIMIAGLVLSIVGIRKSKSSGHKNGLGVAGMVISIVTISFWLMAILFLGTLFYNSTSSVQNFDEIENTELMEELDELEDALKELEEIQ